MGIKRHRRAICLSPHSILVGYSGEIRRDNRLLPLQMTTKYRKFLMQQEFDRSEQVNLFRFELNLELYKSLTYLYSMILDLFDF